MSNLIDEGRAGCLFPARVDPAGAAVDQHGSTRAANSEAVVRSAVDDWRTSIHEASHCVVGRATGQEVALCTIVPGDGFAGMTCGPLFDRSMLSTDDEVPDLCEKIAVLMPRAGEPRINAAEIYAHVHVRVVDLMAGTAGELLFHPECTPWTAHSDIRQARALASLICSSEDSITAYLEFAAEEAKALILRHRAAVLAIATALMVERTLNSAQIDNIVARAPERERRANWLKVLESAADFAARETGPASCAIKLS